MSRGRLVSYFKGGVTQAKLCRLDKSANRQALAAGCRKALAVHDDRSLVLEVCEVKCPGIRL